MRTQLLFLFIFFNPFLGHNQITLNKIDYVKLDEQFKLTSIDSQGKLYFLEGNKLIKVSMFSNFSSIPSSKENYFFSDSSLGPLSKVDIYNNFKLKLWYSNFNTLVILDNFLNEITRVDFNKISSLFEIVNISSANENNVWVFDESAMKIKKFDFFKKVFVENIETQIEGDLIEMKSNYNYLWVLTKKYFYKISYNGLIIYKTENEYEYSKLGFYNDNVLLSNSSEIFHFKNEEELLVKINLEKLFIKDFFVINETLYIYDKDHLNKYLILSY